MNDGSLVCIEGTDASGKATQSKELAAALSTPETGQAVIMSFPRYDGPFGDVILRSLRKESVMYRANRPSDDTPGLSYSYSAEDDMAALRGLFALDQYEGAAEIRRLTSCGITVILDRYWPSNVCYGAEDGFDSGVLRNVSSSLPVPDIFFFIDVSVEEAARRRPQARDRYEKDKAKLARVRQRYLDMWWLEGRDGVTLNNGDTVFFTKPLWIVIDGEQPKEKITEQMLNWVKLVQHVPVRQEVSIVERHLNELDPHVAETLRNQIEERVKRKP